MFPKATNQIPIKITLNRKEVLFTPYILGGTYTLDISENSVREILESKLNPKFEQISISEIVNNKPVDIVTPQIKEEPKYQEVIEFPAELMGDVDKRVFKILSTKDSDALSKEFNKEIVDIAKQREALTESAKKDWMEQHPGAEECPACIEGSVLRKLTAKLIPHLYNKIASTQIFALLNFVINFVNKGISDISNYTTDKDLAAEITATLAEIPTITSTYFAELQDQLKRGGCSSCTRNAIKKKYNTLIINKVKELLHSNG